MNTPNHGFPELSPQKGISVSVGRSWADTSLHWVNVLGQICTGWSANWTDLGNRDNVGHAYSLMPYLERGVGRRATPAWSARIALGMSYIDRKHHQQKNPLNLATSTDVNWTFRAMIQRNFHSELGFRWKLGLGYIHHSNGHIRLPNQGYNSFVLSMGIESSRSIGYLSHTQEGAQLVHNWLSVRLGLGMNSLSLDYNDPQPVLDLDISFSRVYRHTLRIGFGLYLRHYRHYKNLLQSEDVVLEAYPDLIERPYWNASSCGLDVELELLMGHVGAEMDIGINLFKPAYKLDWMLNEGHFEEGEYHYGEMNWYYTVKRYIASRLALNYYLKHTEKEWQWNPYASISLQANLGQADFTSLNFGIVRKW
ncbi:MAG: hypothetical protein HKN79_07440 [Flavobacteriales bacterium]|nr:hypothetical protein [Flavobacteriales bacterium]